MTIMFLEAAKLTDACEITDPESDSLLASSGGKKKTTCYLEVKNNLNYTGFKLEFVGIDFILVSIFIFFPIFFKTFF